MMIRCGKIRPQLNGAFGMLNGGLKFALSGQNRGQLQMANGIVIIVISLLMATVQTGGAGFDLVADDVEAVLHAATRPVVG